MSYAFNKKRGLRQAKKRWERSEEIEDKFGLEARNLPEKKRRKLEGKES